VLILDSDFSEKLKNVLSDPEAMAKITAIASNLGMGNVPKKSEETSPQAEIQNHSQNGIAEMLSSVTSGSSSIETDPRLALLTSLKPFLREEKRGRIDALTRALGVASMMKNFRK
jgi:hypothetical protein